MQYTQLNSISNFIRGVTDDYLHDLFVRGKYCDVMLPMPVLRHLDVVLEPTKKDVLDQTKWFDEEQFSVLEQAANQAFHNTSQFSLKGLTSRSTLRSIWT